jgi:hypothetical protein
MENFSSTIGDADTTQKTTQQTATCKIQEMPCQRKGGFMEKFSSTIGDQPAEKDESESCDSMRGRNLFLTRWNLEGKCMR